MLSLLREKIKDKKIALLGFGREGRSTYAALVRAGGYGSITVLDKNDVADKSSFGACFVIGSDYQKSLSEYDLIFKSPGIVLENPDSIDRTKLTSQTEVFLARYGRQVVGITGTKGKSTTTTLIHHILEESRGNAVLVGNIGIPAFDRIDDIDEDTVIAYELSCHQLEYTDVSPHIAVLLNTFEEHLDHYGTYENYVSAKKNIYRYQNGGDFLFCNKNNIPDADECAATVTGVSDSDADVIYSEDSISFGERKITFDRSGFSLRGMHNIYNIAVAYAVCVHLGISDNDFLSAVESYRPLPHRLEVFAEIGGVKYVDDSISTACETTVQAVTALGNVGVLLLGGMDRGIDYSSLIEFLRTAEIPNIICMYDSGRRIFNETRSIDGTNLFLVNDLLEACTLAKSLAKDGEYCVLSPASASYGFFKNFEERGDRFKEYIKSE